MGVCLMANRDHLPFQHIDVFPRILLICELLREVSGEDRSFHRVGITEACKRLPSKVDYLRGLNPALRHRPIAGSEGSVEARKAPEE
jgi:hypothetical protein